MFGLDLMKGGSVKPLLAALGVRDAEMVEVPASDRRAALVDLGTVALAPGASLLCLSGQFKTGKKMRALLIVTD